MYLIHDGYTEGKTEVEAVLDKRLLVIESEFANVLQQSNKASAMATPYRLRCATAGTAYL